MKVLKATTISICHGKGGVGKTLIAMVLAGELCSRGMSILVVNCDT